VHSFTLRISVDVGRPVTVAGSATRAAMPTSPALRERLRTETAEWHDRVEALTDVPRSVRTRADYVGLLARLHFLHLGFECRLGAVGFDPGWRSVGVDIARHGRAGLLAADIAVLAADPEQPGPARSRPATGSVWSPTVPSFGHALGCLYVLEGSALGGRLVADIVRATLGDVPTTFLNSEGRLQDKPWPAVVGALQRFEAQGGDGNQVIAGACDAFATFAVHLRAVPERRSPFVSGLARS
jgi:heme oxygenase